MDVVESLSQRFGDWYENLLGGNSSSELRPKDILRKILRTLDDNRSEGIDGRVYVPNRYILELNLPNDDERDFLLSFIDEDELATVINRYIEEKDYSLRGPIGFTINSAAITNKPSAKLNVKARFEKGSLINDSTGDKASDNGTMIEHPDEPTIAANLFDDLETIAELPRRWATLAVTAPDGRVSSIQITGNSFTIGRSSKENNLVLSGDGKVSKYHARIQHTEDGTAVLHDLCSTNGVMLNEQRLVGNALLEPFDQLQIGEHLLVYQPDDYPATAARRTVAPKRKSIIVDITTSDEQLLSSDNLVGQSITSDLVLSAPGIAQRQARIIAHESGVFTIEDLSGQKSTLLNDRVVQAGERLKLTNGDRIQFGPLQFQYREMQA